MSGLEHYILIDRTPIAVTLLAWAKWWEAHDKERIVAQDTVGNSFVSTVFLGLDHNFFDKGPPLFFESLVFDGPLADTMRRYSTWQEAMAGHKALVADAQKAGQRIDAIARESGARINNGSV